MLILAIESSCDEFSIALVEDGKHCHFMETLSQIELHAQFGGVIPELASREHTKYFSIVLERITNFLEGDWGKVDAIAVTIGPGLSGSLLIGIQVAKVLATLLDKPLIPVHHVLGHIFSTNLSTDIVFPYLALVASGGHTELVYCRSYYDIETIGATRDDAVGEVYDKIAKKLGLPYPGGPIIDKLSQEGEVIYHFTKPKLDESYAFSFSGIKSAVINLINNTQQRKEELNIPNIAASFQQVVVDELLQKLEKAMISYPAKMIGLCGGVSANSALRKNFKKLETKYSEKLFVIPKLEYCGDNAAMIGTIAYYLQEITDRKAKNILECAPNISIDAFMQKQKADK